MGYLSEFADQSFMPLTIGERYAWRMTNGIIEHVLNEVWMSGTSVIQAVKLDDVWWNWTHVINFEHHPR